VPKHPGFILSSYRGAQDLENNNKAPGVLNTGRFIATLDVSDFIISAGSKIVNLSV
jgi:hypothetical protein